MQSSFNIEAASGAYSITIGKGLLADVLARHPQAVCIIDERLQSRLPASVRDRIPIEALESNKSLEASPGVIAALRKLNANRDTHIIAIGGGIIQDIATFAASIYMRGVPWTYLPTTLLGMVDSCIGGKSSLNVLGYKNLAGNFYPPQDVVIDTDFISTLDTEMISGGLCEAAKICYARGPKQFQAYLATGPHAALAPQQAGPVISASLLTKKWFIEIDEFDQKERLLLNFGHTFGHAIEAGTDFAVSHGVAVGLGIFAAVHFATLRGELTAEGARRAADLVQHIETLITPASGPVIKVPPVVDLSVVMQKFEYDKKHKRDTYRIIIPRGDGGLELTSFAKSDETRETVLASYRLVFEQLGWSCSG